MAKTEVHRELRKDGKTHSSQYCSDGPRAITRYGEGAALWVHLRYDDDCRNGHDTFAITGTVRVPGSREPVAGGRLHDDIAQVYPEYAHLIPWHLCSSDGPMHYLANTVFHAGDRDHYGLKKGEPSTDPRTMIHQVRFGTSPIQHKVDKRVYDLVFGKSGPFEVVEVPHARDPKTYRSKYTFKGIECEWYQCPFDTLQKATQMAAAFAMDDKEWSSHATHIGEGKERDLDAARRAAVWPDATDEELCLEPGLLRAKLTERLPALLEEFKSVMRSVGFNIAE